MQLVNLLPLGLFRHFPPVILQHRCQDVSVPLLHRPNPSTDSPPPDVSSSPPPVPEIVQLFTEKIIYHPSFLPHCRFLRIPPVYED